MRTYEKSHPWIKFQVDFREAKPFLWIGLGECQSKCRHLSWVPLQPKIAQKLHHIYLARGVLATTAIEGNTLSEQEVLQQIEGTLDLPPSRKYLGQETQNILNSCNQIATEISRDAMPALSVERIKELNRQVLTDLELSPEVEPGRIRGHGVTVGRYRGAPPEDCEYLLGRLCEWLASDVFSAPEGAELVYSIIKAVLAHLYLAWIHPFGDGNGRTARLVELQILLASGVPSDAAHLLSNHYNQTRTDYYRQLDRASRSGGEALPFLEYSVQGFLDGLTSQLEEIRKQQVEVMWRDYVYDAFRTKKSAMHQRRRDLVLELSNLPSPVRTSELRTASAKIAAAYAAKTEKTITRDVNELVKMKLLKRDNGNITVCKDIILEFLPVMAAESAGCGLEGPGASRDKGTTR